MRSGEKTSRLVIVTRPSPLAAAVLAVLVLMIFAAGCGAPDEQTPAEPGGQQGQGPNTTGLPLELPAGYSISVFASDLGGPRVMAFDSAGNLLVSIPSRGTVMALPDRDGDGTADNPVTVVSGLDFPHGLAFLCDGGSCRLYVAETSGVRVFDYDAATFSASERGKILDLPAGGGHSTRTIIIADTPAGKKLLISIGSSCNACIEDDPRRASIQAAELDGGNLATYASGLRNSVFMAFHPVTGELWATEMGRDNLGDDIPPDEINIIEEGHDYGWPYCYGNNVTDTVFGATAADTVGKIPSYIDIQAHSAPLGLAFVTAESWPQEYRGDLLVAFHGSWNRSVPTGYKVVRFRLDEGGAYQGQEDFITGWLTADGDVLGRPAGLLMDDAGTLYISDDSRGVIYSAVPPLD